MVRVSQMVRSSTTLALLGALAAATPARTEILGITRTALAEVREVRTERAGDADQVVAVFPGVPLPLTSRTELADPNEPAGGAALVHFDELSVAPSSLRISAGLSSTTPRLAHTVIACAEDLRTIRFTAEETGAAVGTGVSQAQRIVLPAAALAVFGRAGQADLGGAALTLSVSVERETDGRAAELIFSGRIEVRGEAGGVVAVAYDELLVNGLRQTAPVDVADGVALFGVVTVPATTLSFRYGGLVGESFRLRTRVQLTAANVPNGAGVLAAVGPADSSLADVLTRDWGSDAAQALTAALERERGTPTGGPVTPPGPPTVTSGCGVFGLESLLGTLVLAACCARRACGAARLPR
jgi:hypothetical protein